MGDVELVEEWKSLKGIVECGDYYEISNLGRLRSVDREVIARNGTVKRFKGMIRKTKKNNRDYIMASLSQNNKDKTLLIHRMVALAFLPNVDNMPEVNHIDGNKNNNRVDNLEWMTSKENQAHARNNGLSNQHGENSVNSKLTNKQAGEIRKLWNNGGISRNELSELFNVSVAVVGRILRNEAYTN